MSLLFLFSEKFWFCYSFNYIVPMCRNISYSLYAQHSMHILVDIFNVTYIPQNQHGSVPSRCHCFCIIICLLIACVYIPEFKLYISTSFSVFISVALRFYSADLRFCHSHQQWVILDTHISGAIIHQLINIPPKVDLTPPSTFLKISSCLSF